MAAQLVGSRAVLGSTELVSKGGISTLHHILMVFEDELVGCPMGMNSFPVLKQPKRETHYSDSTSAKVRGTLIGVPLPPPNRIRPNDGTVLS
jgi:hypothetical protein